MPKNVEQTTIDDNYDDIFPFTITKIHPKGKGSMSEFEWLKLFCSTREHAKEDAFKFLKPLPTASAVDIDLRFQERNLKYPPNKRKRLAEFHYLLCAYCIAKLSKE